MIEIPLGAEPYSTQEVVLTGVTFTLAMDYSERADRWTMRLERDGATVAVEPVVPGIDLLRRRPERTKPAGLLICMRNDLGQDAPGLNSFADGTVSLYYFEPGEYSPPAGVG